MVEYSLLTLPVSAYFSRILAGSSETVSERQFAFRPKLRLRERSEVNLGCALQDGLEHTRVLPLPVAYQLDGATLWDFSLL